MSDVISYPRENNILFNAQNKDISLDISPSDSSSSTSSGSKKCVQFQLENNQICENFDGFQNIIPYNIEDKSIESINQINCNLELNMSKSASVARNTSPFRPGGRGSKMLAKAIEQSVNKSNVSNDVLPTENNLVLCTGKTPCFAKVMSLPSPDSSSVFIQPLHPSAADTALLVPWDGHLWLAKSNKLHSVKVNIS